jgi:hypothetical protein
LALLLLAGWPRAFTVKRQLVLWLPYLALLMAYGLARLPRPIGELVAGAGLLVTLLFLPAYQREPWRMVVNYLSQSTPVQAGPIWVDELATPVFDYYLNYRITPTNPIRWAPLVGRNLPHLPGLTPGINETLWVVTAESPYRNLIDLLPANFHRQYRLLKAYHEPGIGLYRYQRQSLSTHDQIWSTRLEAQSDNDPARWGLLLPSPLDTCQAKVQ